jgi:hypothetical protein
LHPFLIPYKNFKLKVGPLSTGAPLNWSHYLLSLCRAGRFRTQRARPPVLLLLFHTTRKLSGPPGTGASACIPRHQLNGPLRTPRSTQVY